MNEPPLTVFLDQNQWIDLAHAFDDRKQHPQLYEIGCGLIDAIKAGKLQCPLTSGLIIETYKMANDQHRSMIAEVQAILSQGRVFRDRNFLVRHEIAELISPPDIQAKINKPALWWMSKYFIEAFVDIPRAKDHLGLEHDQLDGLLSDPKFALFHWISTAPEAERKSAMEFYEQGSRDLISRMEARIERLQGEQFSLRQRVYTASLAIDELERILSVGRAVGLNWKGVSDIGPKELKRIMREVPTYHIEAALASRIESLDRPIGNNDLRDMHSYVAAIPNADVLVGEKLFVNLALQAGLGKRYGCAIYSKMPQLESFL